MRTSVSLAAVLAGLAIAPAAAGSQLLDLNASAVRLKVTADGRANISYRVRGRAKHVVAWGAINAQKPSRTRPQVSFELDYASGPTSGRNVCSRYDGPRLPYLVTACKAPDGSYWALQRWLRAQPPHGLPTRKPRLELRLSHWKGALPVITVRQDWAYNGRVDHLYGSLTYEGVPMHGFKDDRFAGLQRHSVWLYVDTRDSAYGRGWRRESGFVAHSPRGVFCYSFVRHGSRPAGTGKAYRVSVAGPGVLPDTAVSLTRRAYNAAAEERANEEQRTRFADSVCKPN
ncbi:MAG: hypothetical protein ABR521_07815 [Gaiellaceae bacterium]